jgi:elongation factor 1 alpha-like protein
LQVEGGTIAVGDPIACRPGDESGQVRAVERHGRRVPRAQAGDVVTLSISGIDTENIRIGSILCAAHHPIPQAAVFLAQIVVFDIDEPITKGYQATMYLRASAEPVSLTKILCTVNKSSGQVLKKKPRLLHSQASAVVQVTWQLPVLPHTPSLPRSLTLSLSLDLYVSFRVSLSRTHDAGDVSEAGLP